jgi:hypothetical protein
MNRLLAVMGGMVIGTAVAAQADVLLLGGLEPAAPPPPVVYTQPVVYQAPPVVLQVPVYAQQEAPLLYAPPPPCYGPSSDVIYVAGPGSCQQDYCLPRRCEPSNVIYFGRMQACREGYQFRHPR